MTKKARRLSMTLFNHLLQVVQREILLARRKPADWIHPLLFVVLVVILFALALSPDPKILQKMGPGIVWVAVILSTLMSVHRLFQPDFEDGTLEQWLLSPYPFTLLIFAKIFTHWLIWIIPLLIMLPFLGFMLQLPPDIIGILLITVLLGSPLLILMGAMGTALTVGLRNNGLLLALILLPLYIPMLILTTGAVNLVLGGLSPAGPLAWLGCLTCLALMSAPLAAAFSLKTGMIYR